MISFKPAAMRRRRPRPSSQLQRHAVHACSVSGSVVWVVSLVVSRRPRVRLSREAQVSDESRVLRAQIRPRKQVGPALIGSQQRLLVPPLLYPGVITRKQNVGHSLALEFRRPRVVRIFQQPSGMQVVCGSVGIAQGAGQEPRHRVDHKSALEARRR